LIADEGYSPAWGARPLRRAISNRLEDSLAEAILQGSIKDDSTVFVDLDEQGSILLSSLKQPVLDYQTVG
jgi:ATP-dependent Clp protease ATP-binding subunit ClpC